MDIFQFIKHCPHSPIEIEGKDFGPFFTVVFLILITIFGKLQEVKNFLLKDWISLFFLKSTQYYIIWVALYSVSHWWYIFGIVLINNSTMSKGIWFYVFMNVSTKHIFFPLQNTFLMGNRYIAKLLCETANNLDYVGK